MMGNQESCNGLELFMNIFFSTTEQGVTTMPHEIINLINET